MTATERYKMLLANALERVCVLEEQLELAQQRIAELETTIDREVILNGDREPDPVR